MKRKVIRQGKNTLTITLPSEWAKKFNISAGDEIDLEEKDKAIILKNNNNVVEKKTTINIEDFTIPLLWRFFQGAYRAGVDEIKITFNKKTFQDPYHYYTTQFDYKDIGEEVSKKPTLVAIQSLVDRFVGMEVLDVGEGYVIVKEMGQLTTKEFDNSLKRVFLTIFQLFDRVIEAIEKNEISDSALCKDLHAIDLNVDRFVDYCCRILNKLNTSFPEKDRGLLYSSLFLLELLADEFKYIGKHLTVSKKSVKDCEELAKKVREHFNLYYKLFYNFNREDAISFGKKDQQVYAEHYLFKNKNGESRSIARHLMMISKFVLALVELKIEMEY